MSEFLAHPDSWDLHLHRLRLKFQATPRDEGDDIVMKLAEPLGIASWYRHEHLSVGRTIAELVWNSRHRHGNENMFHVLLWRNMKKYVGSLEFGNMKKFFQVPEIWRNVKKYEGNMKKYVGTMKKYVGNMKIRTLPIYGQWDLEKFQDHYLISGEGGGLQFPGLGVPQRKDMKHVKKKVFHHHFTFHESVNFFPLTKHDKWKANSDNMKYTYNSRKLPNIPTFINGL